MPDASPTLPLPAPTGTALSPTPTADEAAAIVAAMQVLWPRPSATAERPPRNTTWRFSSRWWARPVPLRRERPLR